MNKEQLAAKAAKADYRSGLEQVAALARGEYPVSPMTKLMPFETSAPSKGEVHFTATPEERHLNGMGIVHGGWVMTMLDNAMGLAAHTMVEAGEYCPSQDTSVTFLRPVFPGGDPLSIHAEVTGQKDREIFVEGRIAGSDGDLFATGTSTCVLIRPEH